MLLRCTSRGAHQFRSFSTSDALRLTATGHRLVLGIESSCDDSCASLVSAPSDYFQRGVYSGARIHNSVVIKQDHGITRGIEPLNASNAHSANLPVAIRESLRRGQEEGVIQDPLNPMEIDAIAVTRGPGMAGSLSQGLSNAKLLSALWDRPLVYVHHMVAHTLTPFLLETDKPIEMPFLVLLLSGGHTQLVLCKSTTEYQILATSHDDSIGDAFDKVARMLQIPFDWAKTAPGAALEAFAEEVEGENFKLPVPFRNKYEFSYSGLKAAVERLEPGVTSERQRRSLAFAFQKAAFSQIQDKIRMSLSSQEAAATTAPLASSLSTPIKDLVISGGVASNEHLRKMVREALHSIGRQDVRVHFPPIALCTDNAAMIAHAGLVSWDLTRDLSIKPLKKWSLEDVSLLQ